MTTNASREQFNRQAIHYNAQWNDWNRESLQWMVEHSNVQRTDRVLDVATGTGFTALRFAELAGQVVGIDVAGGMLEQGRAKAGAAGLSNVTFEEAAAEAIPFPDGSFDLVTCRIAAHHFNSVSSFVREAVRVLRPGGRLLVADSVVPDNEPELDQWQNTVELLRDPSHVRNYTPDEWRRFVEDAGLMVEEITTTGGVIPITFVDWLRKSGCEGDRGAELRHLFTEASPRVKETFGIEPLEDSDIAFRWLRVVLSAKKQD